MKASICLSTHNKPHLLKATFDSIFSQKVPFDYEVIVVDDGSKDSQIETICKQYPIVYRRIERPPVFRNPCIARNVAYRMAKGDVIIAQSDEVVHVTKDAIEQLVTSLEPGLFVLANVFCLNPQGKVCGEYTGPGRLAPLFFLGSLYRSDLYAVGGNDEDFIVSPAREDVWFGKCLTEGLKLLPFYNTKIVGHHQWHTYCTRPATESPAREVYRRKERAAKKGIGKWESASGPWPYTPGKPLDTEEVFTTIYEDKHWGEGESASGSGSSLDATHNLRQKLPNIFKYFDIKTVLDIPCGDFNWMQSVDLSSVKYVGADVVSSVVLSNSKKFTEHFEQLNILEDKLPAVDLIVCRDCLVHFSFADVKKALANIVASGSKYILTTTFPTKQNKKVIQTGQWTAYNLQAKPFDLPEPLLIINEDCRECYPSFNDKSMGLWEIKDLIECLK